MSLLCSDIVWPVPSVGEIRFCIDFLNLIEFSNDKTQSHVVNYTLGADITPIAKAWHHVVVSHSIIDGTTKWKSSIPFPFLCESGITGYKGTGTDSVEVYRALALCAYGMAIWENMINRTSGIMFKRTPKLTFGSQEMVVSLSKSARAMVLARYTIEQSTGNIKLSDFDSKTLPFLLLDNGYKIYTLLFDILMYNVKPKPPNTTCTKAQLRQHISYVHVILSSTKDSHYPPQFAKWYMSVKQYFLTELIYLYGIYLYQENEEPFEAYNYSKWKEGECRKTAIIFSWGMTCLKAVQSSKKQVVGPMIEELKRKIDQDYWRELPSNFNADALLEKIKGGSEWTHQEGYISMFEKQGISDPKQARQKLFTQEGFEPIQF